jgi:hypothetical protein
LRASKKRRRRKRCWGKHSFLTFFLNYETVLDEHRKTLGVQKEPRILGFLPQAFDLREKVLVH